MKRLLIVRYPAWMPIEAIETSHSKTKDRVGDDFIILPFIDKVDKVEVEIVYDPHFKGEGIEEKSREFTQVDTSTGSYMEGRGSFERVNSSDKR